MAEPIAVRRLDPSDRTWVARTIRERWGSDVAVAHGVPYRPAELPGYVAESGGQAIGLLTYHVDELGLEVVTIDALTERRGVGTALLTAAVGEARTLGCRRLWLITTNDNLPALAFYVRFGLRLVAVRLDALERSRALKPEIPATGHHGIPIRDELEFELSL
jgi:ribosomal protein S18 acetylase RimI-like enzyme